MAYGQPDTISVVRERRTEWAPQEARRSEAMIHYGGAKDKLLDVLRMIEYKTAMWLRSRLAILFKDCRRSPGHVVVPVQKSERTTPHEGSVSGRQKTGTWRFTQPTSNTRRWYDKS